MRVTLVESRWDEWAARFTSIRERIAALLPTAAVEHIGSTSVPGLPAKDVVDVLVGVSDIAVASGVLARNAFVSEGAKAGHEWLCWPNSERREFVIHVVTKDDQQWRDRIRFRDILRSDPKARARYLAVKREAAAEYQDWARYTAAKAAVVQSILAESRA